VGSAISLTMEGGWFVKEWGVGSANGLSMGREVYMW